MDGDVADSRFTGEIRGQPPAGCNIAAKPADVPLNLMLV